jgi:phenylalanyl-tRNA synthetase beta chain
MKVLYNWLKEFVALTAPPEELRSRLSLSGTAVEALEQTLAGPMLDAELTSNRADCLGHYGIAREAAVLYGLPLKPLDPRPKESAEPASSATRVQIDAPELCGRYTARVLRGVKVGPSPDWLRQRLEALGQASINNVVDATNYAMLELGHPLHAFDMDLLAEKRIVVRRARPGEKMRTLDGIERALKPEMCVIADASRAVAIAGMMGGADSEIRFASRNILLESAWFDPISIRRTSKTLGLRTEASMRFERGADLEMAETASRRCAELIQQVGGGEALAGVVDAYPGRAAAPAIELTRKEFLRVIGADVPDARIEATLLELGFAAARSDTATRDVVNSPAAAWKCTRPSWRGDVSREVDLIEEVARIYGVDKFPARLPAAKLPAARLDYTEAEDRLHQILIGLGYQEIITIPIVDEPSDAMFRSPKAIPARIVNPLAEDASLMRSTGAVTMARTLEWNLNHGQRNVRLFEFGKTYGWNGAEPVEQRVLTLGATGLAREKSIAETERAYTFADLKGDLDQIGQIVGAFAWKGGGPEWLHAAHSATIAVRSSVVGPVIGHAGQLSRRISEKFKLRQDAYVAELELEPLCAAYKAERAALRYKPLSRFPVVERDFSLVLPDGTTFAAIREAIRALGIREVVSIDAVDLFRGKNIPEGKFAMLVRLKFESHEATLTETQVTDFSSRILAALEQNLGATLRA